jgi:hypothetical protein
VLNGFELQPGIPWDNNTFYCRTFIGDQSVNLRAQTHYNMTFFDALSPEGATDTELRRRYASLLALEDTLAEDLRLNVSNVTLSANGNGGKFSYYVNTDDKYWCARPRAAGFSPPRRAGRRTQRALVQQNGHRATPASRRARAHAPPPPPPRRQDVGNTPWEAVAPFVNTLSFVFKARAAVAASALGPVGASAPSRQ